MNAVVSSYTQALTHPGEHDIRLYVDRSGQGDRLVITENDPWRDWMSSGTLTLPTATGGTSITLRRPSINEYSPNWLVLEEDGVLIINSLFKAISNLAAAPSDAPTSEGTRLAKELKSLSGLSDEKLAALIMPNGVARETFVRWRKERLTPTEHNLRSMSRLHRIFLSLAERPVDPKSWLLNPIINDRSPHEMLAAGLSTQVALIISELPKNRQKYEKHVTRMPLQASDEADRAAAGDFWEMQDATSANTQHSAPEEHDDNYDWLVG